MEKLFKLLTVSVLFLSSQAYSNQCIEENLGRTIELGGTGRDYWVDSIGNGLRGEFEKQIQKKEDLFDKFLPELEFDIGPKGKFKLTFTRSVKDHLPIPSNKDISKNDFFTLQVKNNLVMELSAGLSGPYLFSGTNAGLTLTHATHLFPGKKQSHCDLYSRIIDTDTERGRLFMEGINQDGKCVERDKSKITEAYEYIVDKVSDAIGWGLEFLTDSEKNKIFADDILAPLKVHSTLGIPMKHEVFFENSNDLNIGDIIEHTSYYGVTPGGVKLDVYGLFSPSYSGFYRIFRTVTFKKEMKNFVLVEFEDTVVYGENTLIYKLKPKLFDIIKFNIGRWGINDFKQDQILNRFRINLNKSEGRTFFRKVLKSLYNPSIKIGNDETLIDASPYAEGVEIMSPVKSEAVGEDNQLQFQLPGLFEFENSSHGLAENIEYEGREYTRGNKYHKEAFVNKLSLNLGLFKIRKKDQSFDCKMRLSSDFSVAEKDNSALNIQCKYRNKFATTEKVKKIEEYLQMLMSGALNQEDIDKLRSIDYKERDYLTMLTNLSFSDADIRRILQSKPDDIYNAVSKAIFGEKAENIFAERHHKKWRRANLTDVDRGSRSKKISRLLSCSLVLEKLGITKGRNTLYDKYEGVAGKDKGIRSLDHSRCYSYYLLAKETAESILILQNSARSKKRLNNFLEFFEGLDKVGFVQTVLSRLAGGLSPSGVHFQYVVDSPLLEIPVARSNGRKYEVEDPNLRLTLSQQLKRQLHPRIADVRFTYNTCEKDVIMAHFKLNYRPEDRSDVYAKFTLKDFSVGSDVKLDQYYVPFENHIFRDTEGVYHARIQLENPINEDEAHNMYFELMNENNFRLSREMKIYLKKVNSVLEELEEQEAEEAEEASEGE